MTILGHKLGEVRKAAVSLVFLVGTALALVVSGYDPTLTEALVVLTGAAFAVAGVFLSKNHTPDDLSKAVAQLQGAALSVVGYFTVVDPGTAGKVSAIVAAILSVYLVFRASNDQAGGVVLKP